MDEDEREDPKEYRVGVKEILRVYRWVWEKLLADETRLGARKMLLYAVLATALNLSIPWLFGWIINGLAAKSVSKIVWPVIGIGVVMLLREYVMRWQGRSREYLLGSSQGEVDDTCNRLFMEKSLGQHLRDQDRLSAANMEKGRARVLDVIHILVFDGADVVVLLMAAYVCLWLQSTVAATIMTTTILAFLLWSKYLNRRVIDVCVPLDAQFRSLNRYLSLIHI